MLLFLNTLNRLCDRIDPSLAESNSGSEKHEDYPND